MTHPVVPCILLAEDDENDVFVFKRALNKAGVDTPFVHVSDGQKAVAYLAGNPPFTDRAMFALPGLVISDLKMPGMDGLELLAWAKSQPELCRIPWVILSSSSDRADIHSAHLLGANDYRVKPGVFDEWSPSSATYTFSGYLNQVFLRPFWNRGRCGRKPRIHNHYKIVARSLSSNRSAPSLRESG